MVRVALITSFILTVFSFCSAQEIEPDGYFLQDSTQIGEEILYSLYVKYPKDLEVLFPDSNYLFGYFEYYSKDYFPTRLEGDLAIDSVVYRLVSFEIEPLQYLQVPIFVVSGQDSVDIYPPLDSIYLQEMVTELPDSLLLKSNAESADVALSFNYPYYTIGAVVILILIMAISLLFGKTIRRKIRLYRLRKEYEKFSSRFEEWINKLKNNDDSAFVEEALIIWKSYMEKLEDKPFTKYTTKEILRSGYGDDLKSVLVDIDRSIYGNYEAQGMHRNFESLEDFALERYQNKLKEISNG